MVKKGAGTKKIYLIVAGVLLLCGIIVCFIVLLPKEFMPLDGWKAYTKDRYCLEYAVYDGEKLVYSYDNILSKDDLKKMDDLVIGLSSVKAGKASGWTVDDLAYPIYSVSIKSDYISGVNHHAETLLWSNGYLILSNGDVYRCDVDFTPFEKEVGYSLCPIDVDDSAPLESSMFRPISYAGLKWNSRFLKPATINHLCQDNGIEAEIIREYEDSGLSKVEIRITNNGHRDFYYDDFTYYFYMLVNINGDSYYLVRNPMSSVYNSIWNPDTVIHAGENVSIEYCTDDFAPFPPGEYQIVIPGLIDGNNCSLSAKYIIQ